MVELARIEKVDLREVWSNEAADFTPWLQKNIDQLGDALGMDLEVDEREAPVGTFSLDLLARDGSGRPVIIENQLGTTDHTHLGQILTYAAGHNASVIVWIAKEFRDEHRAALDFLNSRTSGDTEFFGVGVELWKIEGSSAAVNFDLHLPAVPGCQFLHVPNVFCQPLHAFRRLTRSHRQRHPTRRSWHRISPSVY